MTVGVRVMADRRGSCAGRRCVRVVSVAGSATGPWAPVAPKPSVTQAGDGAWSSSASGSRWDEEGA